VRYSVSKGQINFRIEDSLLEAIMSKAKNEGIPYTLWISRQCRIGLGLDSPVPSNVYQSSSAIDEAMLDKRISEILDTRLNEHEKKLTDLEAVITNLNVATHNTKRSGPQSSQFWDQIICNYRVA